MAHQLSGCRVPKASAVQRDHTSYAQESRRGEPTKGRGWRQGGDQGELFQC